LAKRLEEGDITAVFIDTINSVFQGAGISPYLGPVDQYLRLLKAIVCPYGPLIMLGHTNRSGSGMKAIAGSPAFQEVPDALHRIERLKQPQEDGTLIFKWTTEKLRGESTGSFLMLGLIMSSRWWRGIISLIAATSYWLPFSPEKQRLSPPGLNTLLKIPKKHPQALGAP
jgi:hypothetical protein